MDDLRVGALTRAVRHRLGWTQREVARRAGVSQKLVSLLECGRLEELTVRNARRIVAALEIRLPFDPRWRGGDGVRLLDAEHAAIVNAVVTDARHHRWECLVEYTFNHYGERGSVDVVAWHPEHRYLLIAEIKSRLLDTQNTVASLDRKVRIVPRLLAIERGWRPTHVGVVLVAAELTANRSVVARHRATFQSGFPDRTWAVRRWLRHPKSELRGLWFVRPSNTATGKRVRGNRKRVRQSSSRSAPAPTSA